MKFLHLTHSVSAGLFLLMSVACCGRAQADATPLTSSEFHGYTAIQETLQERVFDLTSPLQLATYIGQSNTSDLIGLLGTYKGSVTDSTFQNGKPNAINMILWQLLFSSFSVDVSRICDPGPGGVPAKTQATFRPEFKAATAPLCGWPAASSRTADALYGYWVALIGFDAPEEEFEAWADFVNSPDFAPKNNQDAVYGMTMTAVMNPYFLLKE